MIDHQITVHRRADGSYEIIEGVHRCLALAAAGVKIIRAKDQDGNPVDLIPADQMRQVGSATPIEVEVRRDGESRFGGKGRP